MRQTMLSLSYLQHLFVDDNKPEDLGSGNLNSQC